MFGKSRQSCNRSDFDCARTHLSNGNKITPSIMIDVDITWQEKENWVTTAGPVQLS